MFYELATHLNSFALEERPYALAGEDLHKENLNIIMQVFSNAWNKYKDIPCELPTLINSLTKAFSPEKNKSKDDISKEDIPFPFDPRAIVKLDNARKEKLPKMEAPSDNDAKRKDDSGTVEHIGWGDLSDDDEAREIAASLATYGLGKETTISKPNTISIPEGMKDMLPDIHKIIEKWTGKYGYDLEIDTTNTMRSCGFKFQNLYNEDYENNIKQVNLLDKKKLADLHSLFSFLVLRPDIALKQNERNVCATYALFLIFKKFKMSDKNRKYCKISLKNGDAGESILLDGIRSLFSMKLTAANMIWKAFHVMFIHALESAMKTQKDRIEAMLESFSTTCFTSTQGMLNNAYRDVTKTVMVEVEETSKKGKSSKSKRPTRRTGKDVPAITLSKVPLRDEELKKLQAVQEHFNNFAKIVDEVNSKIDSKKTFQKAIVVEKITEIAYSKISILRRHIKERKNAIREKIALEKKTVNQMSWLPAQAEILADEKITEIKSEDFSWDVNALVTQISPLVTGYAE
jgi:hypothetical protein